MGKRVSLSDIARATGFAVPTVSLALRDLGTFPRATREKIKKAAQALGYYPNPLLASLASKHFGEGDAGGMPLAYIYVPEKDPNTDFTMRHLAKKAQEHARKLGYRLDIFNVDDFKDGVQAGRVLFSRGIQGVVLPFQFRHKMWPGMDWNRFSVVGWGEGTTAPSDAADPLLYHSIVDHFGLVRRAWDETRKRGYRRIGIALLKLSTESRDDELRWGSAQACLLHVNEKDRIPPFVAKIDVVIDGDTDSFGNWVRRYRPDAVIGFNGWFRFALEKEGFQIPEEIGFATLHKEMDADLNLDNDEDEDSGMKEAKMDSVFAALELLDQQIRHHQSGLPMEPKTLMIHPVWIEGETLPPKTAAKI